MISSRFGFNKKESLILVLLLIPALLFYSLVYHDFLLHTGTSQYFKQHLKAAKKSNHSINYILVCADNEDELTL